MVAQKESLKAERSVVPRVAQTVGCLVLQRVDLLVGSSVDLSVDQKVDQKVVRWGSLWVAHWVHHSVVHLVGL
jgi:hypothetical protein